MEESNPISMCICLKRASTNSLVSRSYALCTGDLLERLFSLYQEKVMHWGVFGWAVTFRKATVSFELLKSCCRMWALRNPKVIWFVTCGF